MTCKECTWEIVEGARSGAAMSEALSHHLALCPHCAERWEAEKELSRGMRQARLSVAGLRSSESARERLLAELGQRRRGLLFSRSWIWATAALAALFAAGAWTLAHRTAARSAPQPVAIAQLIPEDLMADNEFVPVPYAPPLAPGEYVEVVQRELSPAALARMGFVIQGAGMNEVVTDLIVGEDGMPRAVRVPESVGIRY